MKKWYVIVSLVLSLCLFAAPALTAAAEEEELDYEGGRENIAPEIELKSNPSTGYHWFFTCDDPEVVEVMENGFVSDNEDLVGAPGRETFRLDGAAEGFAVITFSYARAQDAEPLYTITYQTIVDEELNVIIYQTSVAAN